MSYMSCPHCRSSNRAEDESCYSCDKPLHPDRLPDYLQPEEGSEAVTTTSSRAGNQQWLPFLVSIILTMTLGGLMGFGVEFAELELPFFLEEIALGLICSVAATFCIGKIRDIPDGLIFARLGPAAWFGFLVGLCLYLIWWSFDPPGGFVIIGVIGGLCASLPIAVSFGMMDGESHPFGMAETLNVGAGAVILGILAFVVTEDFYPAVGFAGLGGLVPSLLGGRVDTLAVLQVFIEE